MNVRKRTEALEREILSPYACLSSESKGRALPLEPCEVRTCFQRDVDRIVHSRPFGGSSIRPRCFCSRRGTTTGPG